MRAVSVCPRAVWLCIVAATLSIEIGKLVRTQLTRQHTHAPVRSAGAEQRAPGRRHSSAHVQLAQLCVMKWSKWKHFKILRAVVGMRQVQCACERCEMEAAHACTPAQVPTCMAQRQHVSGAQSAALVAAHGAAGEGGL